MKKKSLISAVVLVVVATTFLLRPIFGEHENPNQKGVENVTAPASSKTVRANIVPLFWRAELEDAIVTVPLKSVEYYGLQIYDTDSQTRVHELTICTESQSLIRIYHILPLGTTNQRLADRVDRFRQTVEGSTGQEWNVPIKQYPTTTHLHMVEYRVPDQNNIRTLFNNFEAAMIEYHMRDLVADQRGDAVRQISIKSDEG